MEIVSPWSSSDGLAERLGNGLQNRKDGIVTHTRFQLQKNDSSKKTVDKQGKFL